MKKIYMAEKKANNVTQHYATTNWNGPTKQLPKIATSKNDDIDDDYTTNIKRQRQPTKK